MFTKVKLKIVEKWRKIPVGGIVALNLGPILNCKVGVGGVAGADCRKTFFISKNNKFCNRKENEKISF